MPLAVLSHEKPAHYHARLNLLLLDQLPAASSVLELGCATGLLGEAYLLRHPACRWTGVDIDAPSVSEAAKRISSARCMDLDVHALALDAEPPHDLVVMGDVLEHLRAPERLLRSLHAVTAPDARLLLCLPNMASTDVLDRLLAGDIVYDPAGVLDQTHLRFFAPVSTFKMLLDAGWSPRWKAAVNASADSRLPVLASAASRLGSSPAMARAVLPIQQMLIECERIVDAALPAGQPQESLSVVVHAPDAGVLLRNLARSPGLLEIGAQLLAFPGTGSAAAAWPAGRQHATGEWILLCRPDCYFPRGWGRSLQSFLARIPHEERERCVIGIAGTSQQPGGARPLGHWIQWLNHHQDGDEGAVHHLHDDAVLLHRKSVLEPDQALGWNGWATNLVLQAGRSGGRALVAALPVPPLVNRFPERGSAS